VTSIIKINLLFAGRSFVWDRSLHYLDTILKQWARTLDLGRRNLSIRCGNDTTLPTVLVLLIDATL